MKPRTVLRTRRAALMVGWHAGNDTGWEVAVDVVLGFRPHAGVLTLGWGWDAAVPLRPWPRAWWRKTTPRGNLSWGFAWFGLFVTLGTVP